MNERLELLIEKVKLEEYMRKTPEAGSLGDGRIFLKEDVGDLMRKGNRLEEINQILEQSK